MTPTENTRQRVNLPVVPWHGADTYKGLVLAVGGVLGILLLWLLLSLMGIAREGAMSLAPLFGLEGVLIAVAWRFSVRRHGVFHSSPRHAKNPPYRRVPTV